MPPVSVSSVRPGPLIVTIVLLTAGPAARALSASASGGADRSRHLPRAAALEAVLAASDGLLYQLPPDGTWVQFDIEYRFRTAGQELSGRQTFRMASVGAVREGSEECRWIEFHIVERGEGRERF